MMSARKYNEKFFDELARDSGASADVVVPVLLQYLQPRSVIDIGCGTGSWLSALRRHGVMSVLGVDGTYVPLSALLIPEEDFIQSDLLHPLSISDTFDLAVCLEVVEHLPQSAALTLLDDLCRLAPVVLFSCAIPFQPGINHVSCHWQSYWVGEFAKRGFTAIDCIRPRVWDDPEVAFWFAQNTFVYANAVGLDRWAALETASHEPHGLIDVVHPRYYEILADPSRVSPLRAFRLGMRAVATRVHR